MLRVTLKSILGHKARLAMTGLAVVLGVALMAGTLVLTDTVGRTFDDLVADIWDGTDAAVRSSDSIETQFGETLREPLDDSLVAQVAAVDGVAAAEGFVQGQARIQNAEGEALGNPDFGPPSFGMSWGEVEPLNPFLVAEGAPPVGPDEVAIDRGTAEEGDIAVGEQVTILSAVEPRTFTVSGLVTFGTIDSPGGSNVALFEMATAQEVLGLPGQVNEIGAVADEGISQQDLVDRLGAALPEGVEAVTGEARAAEDQESFQEGLSFFNTFLLIFALIALFVGAFIIANTFSIILAQRGRELALLRAIGASRRQVLASVMAEALVVGIVASLVGAAFGVGVAALLKGLLAATGIDIPATGVVIQPGSIANAVVTGVAVTVLAALLPALRGSRVPPLAALREVSLDTSATSVVRLVIGVLVLGIGALNLVAGFNDGENAGVAVGTGAVAGLIGIWILGPIIARPVVRVLAWPLPRLRGVTGSIARENASRNPKRTASTAAALMIGVGLVSFISIFATSAKASVSQLLEETVTGDLIITTGGFGATGFSPALAEDVRSIDGVEQVTSIRAVPAEIEDEPVFLAAFEMATIDTVSDPGRVQGDLVGLGPDQIAVSEDTAESDELALGDEVVLRTQTGEHRFTVGAIYENPEVLGSHLLDLAGFDPLVPTPLDIQVFVAFAEGADPVATKAAITDAVSAYGNAEVQDLEEFTESFFGQIDQLLNLIYALLGLAVIIAVIGIANTLALSVHERTHELGLLRAVGMTRSQLRGAIRWEAVIIALLGTALGIGVGIFFGWAMVQVLDEEGFTAFRLPWSTLLVVVVLAGVAGVVSALGPARRAARLEVMEAISTE